MSWNIVGGCSKHPGNNMVNCPLCEIERQQKFIEDNPELLKKVADPDLLKEMEEYNSDKHKRGYPADISPEIAEELTQLRSKPIDRYGSCPNCKTNMDGGDIYQSLDSMDCNINKSSTEMIELAAQYGWTEENKKRFSKYKAYEITHQGKVTLFLQCPKCLHVFNADTGKHFISINEARNNLYE